MGETQGEPGFSSTAFPFLRELTFSSEGNLTAQATGTEKCSFAQPLEANERGKYGPQSPLLSRLGRSERPRALNPLCPSGAMSLVASVEVYQAGYTNDSINSAPS